LGRTGSTATFQHTYSKAGTYTITFTVKDDKGAQTQSTLTVRVAGSTPSPSGPLDLQVELLSSDCYKYNGNAVVCGPAIDMTTYNGNMFVVSDAGYQASRLLAVLDPGTADYLFLYKVPGRDYFSVAQHFYMTDKDQFNVEKLSADTYKYENGGIVTGVSLEFTAQSGYAIVAYTPSGVRYETSRLLAVIDSQGGEFRHLFKQAGNDYFTTAKRFYTSQASNEPESVTAAISAIPTELYQYDSVYVAGKVGRSADQNSGAQKYLVVLAFDDGAAIPKAYSGAISSQGTQVRVEEITLAPGESREVSAYFTANKLGTNFAAIAVYAAGSGGYGLVASDTAKVYVKESGIPSPPNESVTIVLEKGWNQISVPAFSLQVEELADACDISKNVWAYNAATKQYEKAATLGGGHVGFWVRAYSDCKYTIKEPYLTPAPYAFNLKAGWNMIGAPLLATSISSFAGNCKITSGPWNYSPAAGQYGYSVELAPGKGYWVKVAYDCTLGGSDMPPAEPQETAVAKAVVNVAVASSTGSAAASVEPEAVAVNNASN
jgi:PKD repeat protein